MGKSSVAFQISYILSLPIFDQHLGERQSANLGGEGDLHYLAILPTEAASPLAFVDKCHRAHPPLVLDPQCVSFLGYGANTVVGYLNGLGDSLIGVIPITAALRQRPVAVIDHWRVPNQS